MSKRPKDKGASREQNVRVLTRAEAETDLLAMMKQVNELRARCEAAELAIHDICEHCGWKAGSSECKNADCRIAEWRGPQGQKGAGHE